MKFKLQKLILCIVVTVTIFNLFTSIFATSSNKVYATQNTTTVEDIDEDADDDSALDVVFGLIGGTIDGLVGIVSKIIQIPLLLIAMSVQGFIAAIAKLGGSNIQGFITPDDIFFNRVGLTNIDFFTFSGTSSVVQTIRTNIATWYYILRVLATVILLAVLIYIGIRMTLSTVASEQAQYKRMLKDWAVSFALLFLLNYIIIFTIEANNALVELLSGPARVTIGMGVMTKLTAMIAFGGATKSWGAFIVYFALIGMTAAFLIMYIKRMLTIGFLIIISPLITITYSIDKVKDGRAQAVNTWLREFMYNVLIQPFHCIIYLAFISTIINTLGTKASLAKLLLAVICMRFIWKAEEIIKQIFGFKGASSMAEGSLAAVATVNSIAKTLSKNGGKVTKSVANNTKFGQNIMNKVNTSRAGTAYRNLSQRNDIVGSITRGTAKAVKESVPIGIGIAAASIEMGANTKANAAHVGFETYGIAKGALYGNGNQPGSYESIQLSQRDFQRFADLISNNNNFAFQNYRTDATSKNNLRAYAQSLIGANMDYLNNNIQDALRTLTSSDPDYDMTTAVGMQHLRDLQDKALDPNLDFTDPSTNPLGRAWTADEINVVTAIQIRDLAGALNSLHSNYEASGSPNPDQDVDDFINGLT